MNLCKFQRSRSFTDLSSRSLRFNSFNFFSLETAGLFEALFHVEPSWDGETKDCSNCPGYMTNMTIMPIHSKNLKKSSLEPKGQ